MYQYTVIDNQTLTDVCIQLYGNLDYLIELAILNSISIDTVIPYGYVLSYGHQKSQVGAAKYFDLNDITVVTGGVEMTPLVVTTEDSQGRKLRFPLPQAQPNQYKPVAGQSVIDTCLQLYGNLDNLIDFCTTNGALLTQEMNTSQYVVFDPALREISTPAGYFDLNDLYVVTLDNDEGLTIIQTEYEGNEYEGAEYA